MSEKWKISATNSAAVENEAGEIVADCLGGLCTAKNSGTHARLIAAAPDLLEALEYVGKYRGEIPTHISDVCAIALKKVKP